jgi:hypothetical protein
MSALRVLCNSGAMTPTRPGHKVVFHTHGWNAATSIFGHDRIDVSLNISVKLVNALLQAGR